jgi:hypothetical protein
MAITQYDPGARMRGTLGSEDRWVTMRMTSGRKSQLRAVEIPPKLAAKQLFSHVCRERKKSS